MDDTTQKSYYPSMIFRILILAILSFAPLNAYAQDLNVEQIPMDNEQQEEREEQEKQFFNQYDRKYRPLAYQNNKNSQILANNAFTLELVRLPNLQSDQVALRVSQPLNVSGCFTISMPDAQKKILANTLSLKFAEPVVALEKKNPCTVEVKPLIQDTILHKSELMKKNIDQIEMHVKGGADKFDVIVDETRITLIPKNNRFFSPVVTQDGHNPLNFWFYPENTVILYVPSVSPSQEVYDQILKIAQKNKMIPLSEKVEGFENPYKKAAYYFVDPKGDIAELLSSDKYSFIATIEAPSKKYNNLRYRLQNHHVVAKRPSLLE